MKQYLVSKIEHYAWYKLIFDYYKALRVAGSAVFFHRSRIAADGLPVPPPLLLVSTTGTADVQTYVESGLRAKESICGALEKQEYEIADTDRILDFGCGCGRVLRQWRSYENTEWYATDVDSKAVKWCRQNLSFARVIRCNPEPPLPYDPEFFSTVYALSVLTHLSELSQKAWLREWHRILRPGGILLFSLHGEYYRSALTDEERKAFDAGRLVVRSAHSSGTNRCGTYHPLSYVREQLTAGFELLQHIPCGALGNPFQDLYVLRKSAG